MAAKRAANAASEWGAECLLGAALNERPCDSDFDGFGDSQRIFQFNP